MIYYRLLRDNKETGPYSEEEMIAKGFKPYDLLWAEGKSAGWQYPSEVEAFKKYAPIVEEQPYDRFYKKQPAQKLFSEERYNTVSRAAQQPVKANEPAQPQLPQQPVLPAARPEYNYNIQAIPGKNIHVTLPSGNTVNLASLVAKKENKEIPEAYKIAVNADKPALPAEKKQPFAAENNITTTASPVTKEIKPVAPVHTTASMAIPVHENDADTMITPAYQQQPAAGFSWTLVMGGIIGIATLVGLGIMIGLAMNRQKNDLAFNAALNNRAKQTVVPATAKPDQSSAAMPAGSTDESLPQVSAPVTRNKDLVQNAVVKTTLVPENSGKEEKKLPAEKITAEKNKPQQQEEPVLHTKPATTANIEKSLVIHENRFKTGAFGGISGLTCTLFNGSKLPLESVEVQLDYIQANDKVYKTETILFKDISAGTESTIEAPSSSRGVKISSRIIKINAKDAALSNTTVKS